jgi:DNA gyrase subunit A
MVRKNKDFTEENEVSPKERVSVIPIDITSEMKESYINYAMSVITERALPDIRDGLKPVHRRILYSMYEMNLTSSSKPKKSAAVVGDVLAKYHPHGDVAVYDSMVGMAQEFSYRYPLVLGQGNFGSIDGDNAAAMRYTEARMSKLSTEMLRDIEKETVDFVPNYDSTRKEPSVLPTAVPSFILNGTLGIAVGMATNVPPHNLGEVIDATRHLINNKEATTDELLQFVKGPDFPTGGLVFSTPEMKHAYSTGRGGVVVRGEAEIVELKSGLAQIVITSIPYRVNKQNLVMSIAELVQEKKIDGIKGLRDESTRDIRVVIDLKNGIHPQKVLNYLYKHTQLEQTFHFNLVALVDGIPQTLSLKTILSEFVKHREVVVKRRTIFDLRKAEEREHILIGLKKALDHIDKVISIIRSSKDSQIAKVNLIKEFKFTEIQATAILEMKLQKLAGLERKQIEEELKEKQLLIKELKSILNSERKILDIIDSELDVIKQKYNDDRRSKIIRGGVKIINEEDLIPEKESVLVYTQGGYVKRTDPQEYRSQKRGGVGVIDLETKEEDFVTLLINTNTHSDLLFFTNLGKAYQIRMFEIPEGKRATKGKSIMNFLQLSSDEKVMSILPVEKDKKSKDQFLMLVTKSGQSKKMSYEHFKDVRRNGLIAIKLNDKDSLLGALLIEKGDTIILASKKGQAIRFKESDIREMGRVAGGVRAMKISKGDEIIGSDVVKKENEKDSYFFTMSENGLGKKTEVKEYKLQKRGGSGIKTTKITTKTGDLIVAKVVNKEEELIAISKKSQVIKTPLDSIPNLGRQTQGVTIMKLRSGDNLASVVCL